MADRANIFRAAASGRPRLACELRPEGVVAARGAAAHGGAMAVAFAALPEGALTSGLKVPNLTDRGAVTAALESALGAVNARQRELTVVVPDAAARVLLLDFDTLPAKRQEALPVVRFRLRKMVPFDVETAAVSYQTMRERDGSMNVLTAVMPGEVLAEYEAAVREAGYEPGAVLPGTLAAAAALQGAGPTLMVNQSRFSVTTAVTQGDAMLLHRTVDLPAGAAAGEEEMAQAVITTLAWYEDTLRETPAAIHYAGPGGAAAAAEARWLRLADPALRIEDLARASDTTAMTSIPAGITAGVAGALA